MKIEISTEENSLTTVKDGETRQLPLYCKESFEIVSDLWAKVGWDQKYVYTFSWFGRPVIQLPEDMIRIQEVIYRLKPDVIVETGIAHGGSLIFYASLFEAIGHGKVVGVDIEIRPHNREAIECHPLFHRIDLVEGDSVGPAVLESIQNLIPQGSSVMVILDSCHTKAHVSAELNAYHHLVTPDSYIVATDGSMQDLWDVPRGDPSWKEDHPSAAAREFAEAHPEFQIEQPAWPFNESELTKNITHWPDFYLKRL